MKNRHVALYGNVKIPRRYCSRCKCWSLVVDGVRNCCGYSTVEDFKDAKTVRMSNSPHQRKKPTPSEAKKILDLQERKCFYCEQELETWVTRYGQPIRLNLNFDHVEPFAFSQNNYPYNFVAACHVCNGWKSSKMFQSIDVAKDYLTRKWEANRWKKAKKKDLGNIVSIVENSLNKLDPGKLIAPRLASGENGNETTPDKPLLQP